MAEVLVLGGYGNFGKRIAAALARQGVATIVAGRSLEKAEACAAAIRAATQGGPVKAARIDIARDLDAFLREKAPAVVVNTCGPFQSRDFAVALACIRHRIHSIDLADGRDFVTGIASLDDAARAAGVVVVSGASTVPGLSSAVLDHFRHEFAVIDDLRFGISPGQRAERGLATTQAILGYVGRPLKPAPAGGRTRYGWQDLHRQAYPELGSRWIANCDVPDLDLLPPRYGIRHIQFSAGMENSLVHFGLYGLSWLVRAKVPLDLARHAMGLLRASAWFDAFGSGNGGMHMIMRGTAPDGTAHTRSWFIVARNGDGPQIPCVPAIVLAAKLIRKEPLVAGARACLGLVTLDECKAELARFAVSVYEY